MVGSNVLQARPAGLTTSVSPPAGLLPTSAAPPDLAFSHTLSCRLFARRAKQRSAFAYYTMLTALSVSPTLSLASCFSGPWCTCAILLPASWSVTQRSGNSKQPLCV